MRGENVADGSGRHRDTCGQGALRNDWRSGTMIWKGDSWIGNGRWVLMQARGRGTPTGAWTFWKEQECTQTVEDVVVVYVNRQGGWTRDRAGTCRQKDQRRYGWALNRLR